MRLTLLVHVYTRTNESEVWVYNFAQLAEITLDSEQPLEMASALIERLAITGNTMAADVVFDPNVNKAFLEMVRKFNHVTGLQYQFRPMSHQIVG
jgi:hypothetical protein